MDTIERGQVWERGGTEWLVKELSYSGKTAYLREVWRYAGLYGPRTETVRVATLRRDFRVLKTSPK